MTDEEAIKQLAIELCRADGGEPYSIAEREYTNGPVAYMEYDKYGPQAKRAYELGARPKQEQGGNAEWLERRLREDAEAVKQWPKWKKEMVADILQSNILEEREFPQEGDEYFCVNDAGEVCKCAWHRSSYAGNIGAKIDHGRLHQGNVFASQEAAERKARADRVRAKIAAIDAECKPGKHCVFTRDEHEWSATRMANVCARAGAIFVHSIEAAYRVLAETPAEELDLLCAEPEFVVPETS